jgi:DNA-binding HxlR family transcriptional regulator
MAESPSLLALIQNKGIEEILFQLRFFPKRYNKLKKNLDGIISSRTLDTRLNELKSQQIIQLSEVSNKNKPTFEYQLTENGRFLESLVFMLHNIDSKQKPENFTERLNFHNDVTMKYQWGKVWIDLQKICEKLGSIMTLSEKPQENQIKEFSNVGVYVETKKGVQLISQDLIKQAWGYLLKDGILHRNEHEKATYRSSFICALLAQLDYVNIQSKRPIAIYIEESVDFPVSLF